MKRVLREILTQKSMIIMANWSEAEIPEGNFEPAFFKLFPMPEFIEGGGGLEGA